MYPAHRAGVFVKSIPGAGRELVREAGLYADPKLAWALRHPERFPVDINRAEYEMLLRIPGIGVLSAKKIIAARTYNRLNSDHLKKIGVVMKKAKYFLTCQELGHPQTIQELTPQRVRTLVLPGKKKKTDENQLILPFSF